MNNHTERINQYLQNELSPAARTAFEAELEKDEALRNELSIQRQLIEAVMHAGVKAEFAKALGHRAITRKWVGWGSLAAACLLLILLFTYRPNILPTLNQINGSQEQKTVASIARSFIDPPLARIDVPLHYYSFDAEKGDTIIYPSGSVIYFPPSALVDEAGIPIKGKVNVTYREFSDPLDFFVSGIPMSYDSSGKKYIFESAAMCEINVYKEDKAVFVNPNAKPEINLSCTNKDPRQNLYYLDTVDRNWKYIGKDMITQVKKSAKTKATPKTHPVNDESGGYSSKPVKPMKATDDKQAFSVEIEPGSFEELQSYNGLKFQVEDERNYKRSDAEEQWQDVKLRHTNSDGLYDLTFSRPGRTVTYKVRPVLEGSDYEVAMKVFDEKTKSYEAALKSRLISAQIISDSLAVVNQKRDAKIQSDFEENEKMNILIEARNKKVRELLAFRKKKLKDQADVLAREKEVMAIENERRMLELSEYEKEQLTTAEIIRTFPINQFGFWNCDQPLIPPGAMVITSIFMDSLNNEIAFSYLGVVYKGLNAINQLLENKKVAIIPGRENMLWGIKNGSFYYYTYNDFAESGIGLDTKSYIFKMRRSEKEIGSYNDIRKLVGKL
ncbi:MAG: hypothetical protein ABIN36_14855 [Ferruginibacter sp.]